MAQAATEHTAIPDLLVLIDALVRRAPPPIRRVIELKIGEHTWHYHGPSGRTDFAKSPGEPDARLEISPDHADGILAGEGLEGVQVEGDRLLWSRFFKTVLTPTRKAWMPR